MLLFAVQWEGNPHNDVFADSVLKVVLKAQELDIAKEKIPPIPSKQFDHRHFKVSWPKDLEIRLWLREGIT